MMELKKAWPIVSPVLSAILLNTITKKPCVMSTTQRSIMLIQMTKSFFKIIVKLENHKYIINK